ncbi:glycosyltransferase family 4 protein [Chelativorans sp. YIM 93263]|uniref:glycosyltransferase family 4 protein n=1 Tax=Chelativorans sp. YIM 93263 TaxID=2906648 RepID=UPI002378D1A9|nr:glycosyltransferase family 4 protein [Chelativorans sp. YIM 93263]
MRIVHCFRSPVGGIFRHVRDLCEAQIAAGHEVGIVCDSTTGGDYEDRRLEEIGRKLPLGLIRTPMQRNVGLGDLGAAWRTLRVFRRMRPDILHGHGAKGGIYARLFGTAMRVGGRRVARLYSPHGGSLHYDPDTRSGRFYFGIERMMERATDHILFVSDYEKRTYEKKIGRPRAPVSVVYNGLRAEEFIPVGNAPDAADFLYIGMMRDLKGPDLFLDALKEAERQSGRTLTAVMVGDGDDRDKYIAQVDALGFSDRVRFHPAMPARAAFALGRIMVVPSRAEAMPYIVLEALAAGKPMIATRVGGIPEVFAKQTAALCDPNTGSLAERMTFALSDEAAFCREMPSEETLKERFSVEAMTSAVDAIYRGVRTS